MTICCQCIHAGKPFPYAELNQFVDRTLQGSKGKLIQHRLESSIRGFHDALTNTIDRCMSVGEWPILLKKLSDLNACVDRYYGRLFSQLRRQTIVHNTYQPVRDASEAIGYKTRVEIC